MDKVWEVDDAHVVEASFGAFGRKVVKVNGQEVHRSKGSAKEIPFALPDGRPAAISIQGQFVGGPDIDLRVGGQLMVETPKKPIACAACKTVARPYDRFCAKCGQEMPGAEHYQAQKKVGHATGAIKWLAVLFFVFGVLMYFVTKGQADAALARIAAMDAAAAFPEPIDGQTLTVGEVREKLAWEPTAILLINMVLAAIMAVLAWWGRQKPLAAVLIATATYVVVIVANGVADPATLTQGLILKIIIIAFLVKGIKAALSLRDA